MSVEGPRGGGIVERYPTGTGSEEQKVHLAADRPTLSGHLSPLWPADHATEDINALVVARGMQHCQRCESAAAVTFW